MKTEINQLLTFQGISKHGKNRINEHGPTWISKRFEFGTQLPIASPAEDKTLFVLLESMKTGWLRWAKTENDLHFILTTTKK